VSLESSPENRRLKKQRKANTMRFKRIAPSFKDSSVARALVPAVPALMSARSSSARATVGFTTYLQREEESAQRRL
jgi:hypothetical protein